MQPVSLDKLVQLISERAHEMVFFLIGDVPRDATDV